MGTIRELRKGCTVLNGLGGGIKRRVIFSDVQKLYDIRISVPTRRFSGAEAHAVSFVCGSFYAVAAVLSSCDGEHMARKAYVFIFWLSTEKQACSPLI